MDQQMTGSSVNRPSFSEAIWQLPRQYINVLCRPSVKTFNEEQRKTSWGIVWLQFYLLIGFFVGLLLGLVGILFVYRMVLHGFTIMAVHGLSGGRAMPAKETRDTRPVMDIDEVVSFKSIVPDEHLTLSQ